MRVSSCLLVVTVATFVAAAPARMAHANPPSAANELVREAHAHEAARDEDKALRRYMDAIALDPTSETAYLGLASLRMRLGDPREAERVYSLGLEHVPAMSAALLGRARARRASGRTLEAAQDLESYAAKESDPNALRELARWYGEDHLLAMQLTTWRRILTFASRREDATLTAEASTMVRALQIVVGSIDPVAFPVDPTPVRRAIVRIARRGG